MMEYVKGQGWVYVNPAVISMNCGKVVCLERRQPRPGERFDATPIGHTSEPFDSDWISWFKTMDWDRLTLRYESYQTVLDKYWFIVFVPLD